MLAGTNDDAPHTHTQSWNLEVDQCSKLQIKKEKILYFKSIPITNLIIIS